MYYFLSAQRFATSSPSGASGIPALGRGRLRRPARKRLRRVKLHGMSADRTSEPPASTPVPGAKRMGSPRASALALALPSVRCTLCWVRFYFTRFLFLRTLQIHFRNLSSHNRLVCNPSDLATNHEASQNVSFGRNTPVL